MIFSKDKKPTEVGMYWRIGNYGKPVPQVVYKAHDGELWTKDWLSEPLDKFNWLWGDKIEIPTVEDFEHLGRQG